MTRRKQSKRAARLAAKTTSLKCEFSAPVTITAAHTEDGATRPPGFSVLAYNGGAMTVRGWDLPVVIALDGMSYSNNLVANLDHEPAKRVGNVTAVDKSDTSLTLNGIVSAATAHAEEVVDSAANGFTWQASVEASPNKVTEVSAGSKFTANGQEFEGPAYLVSKSTLTGFAFVSHGADDETTVTIAATANQRNEESDMDPKVKAWAENMGLDVENATDDEIAQIEANFAGQAPKPNKPTGLKGFEALQANVKRTEEINSYALTHCERNPQNLTAIRQMAEQAIEAEWSVDKFRLELLEAQAPTGNTPIHSQADHSLTSRVLEAAVCQAGRLDKVETMFDDQTLQAAHDRFKGRIGLTQLLLLGAEANGYRSGYSSQMTVEAQRAAFGLQTPNSIRAAGFSTIAIPTILSNVANKFLRIGWNSVDMTPTAISSVRSVRDFKTITTVSLTGDLTFDLVGPDGEIKHGTLGETTYSNKADTYARMLAITRQDFINDDLNALTDVPQKLGRGGALKLNDIFWTEFLDNASFFAAGNNNISTGALDETSLDAANTVFMDQTDPDGNPLGTMPAILLVPTGVESAALRLMNSELVIGATDRGDANIWRSRFTVESSPYMSNANYTGFSAVAWYLLANPTELPVIEIVALNGQIEPVVESADADFNVLGVEMRGYSDVGVRKQEFRGGVRSTGA